MKPVPGNLYAAQGGKPTKFWLVVAVRGTSCPMLGLDADMNVVSAQTYATYALERRNIVGFAELSEVRFQTDK